MNLIIILLILFSFVLNSVNITFAARIKTNGQEDYEKTLILYFKRLNLIPIFLPEDQKVGDVYNVADGVFLDRAEKCFPKLSELPPVPSTLPQVIIINKGDAKLSLNLSRFFVSSASANIDNVSLIRFSDVSIQRVAAVDLQRNLSDQCTYLKDYMTGPPVDRDKVNKKIVIIGRLLVGRPLIYTGLLHSADARALADLRLEFSKLKRFKGQIIDANADTKIGYAVKRGILLESKEILPIAFSPAFLPKDIIEEVRGANNNYRNEVIGYDWYPFEPDFSIDHKNSFEDFLFDHSPNLKSSDGIYRKWQDN